MTVRLIALLALALVGCADEVASPATGTDDVPSDGNDGADGADGDIADRDTAQEDTAQEDTPPCEPSCQDGVCAPDGCGGACPACGNLPPAYGTSCKLDGEPPSPGPVMLVPAFANVPFNYPVHIGNLPDGRLLIVEKRGVIKVIPDSPDATNADLELFLDIQTAVDSSKSEMGLLSVAIHPKFSENGQFFVNYTASKNSKIFTIVARYQTGADGLGDPGSEERLLEILQPYSNHNGGQIAFGHDGMLYIGMGDGGSGGDPGNRSQNLGELLGKMLRIDVDAKDTGKEYAVPGDNPFLTTDGAKPEIWAYGLRNPWRFSFDSLTGQLWTSDVGQDLWEEVDIVESGKNYGWRIMEGNHCYDADTCEKENLTLPVAEYAHNDAGDASVTGGFVYRGAAMPDLQGTYVYADYVFGDIYGVRFDGEGEPAVSTLAETDKFITSFGLTADQELLVAHTSYFNPEGGEIFRLVSADSAPPNGPGFPRLLSETGCFTDLKTLTPAEGLLPYDVNVSLWHDGADSVRYLALPTGGKMTPTAEGAWTMPVGTRLIKTFVYGDLRLETRFVIQRADGIRVHTYRWNDAGTDATLLDSAGERIFELEGETRTWHFPSRSECRTCHNEAAGRFLGWKTAQLDRGVTLGEVTGNQLDLWGKLGILESAPETVAPYPKLDDTTVSVASRARAAMDVNCATCHRPGGPPVTQHDLRYETAVADMGVCDTTPEHGDFDVAGEKLVVPGQPDKSNLLLRMKTMGVLRMPGGTRVLDEEAIALVTDWIAALPGCQ